MKTIHKYPFTIRADQKVWLPVGAEVNHVGLDPKGDSCLWAIVDPAAEMEAVHIRVIGTGMEVDEEHIFLGTFNMDRFVWHVFIQP